jgi:hypothetical protein
VRLKHFQLAKQEWELLEKLFPLLEVSMFIWHSIVIYFLMYSQVFLIATKQMSQSKTPLIYEVIPLFDIITRALNEYKDDLTLPPVIRIAAARGRTMLNKYYGLTDDSIIYRITMCTSSFNSYLL